MCAPPTRRALHYRGQLKEGRRSEVLARPEARSLKPEAPKGNITPMYSVTKRIEFCYGHRLLDYNGMCAHPHGHNAVAELEIQSESLDRRNMVMDFSDIKRAIKTWVDRELDHKMILRADDPLTPILAALGEPVYALHSKPTAGRIARLIFDVAREQGLPVAKVTVWETPDSWATYSA